MNIRSSSVRYSVIPISIAIIGMIVFTGRADAQPPVPALTVDPLPLPVKDVDAAGRQPYSASIGFSQFGCFTLDCSNFTKSGGAILFDGPEVPEGKRLVIMHVSGQLPNDNTETLSIALQTQQVLSPFSAIWSFYGPFFTQQGPLQGFTSEAFATYGPGERPHIHTIIPVPNNFVGLVNISGYLIDAE